MKKTLPIILVMVLVIVLLMIRNFEQVRSGKQSKSGDRSIEFIREGRGLQYTKHAKCRMDCREISVADVEEILKEGKINHERSDRADKPCPTFALEGYTKDKEHLRIVYAQCESVTRVVTVINLEEEFECNCPGDKR